VRGVDLKSAENFPHTRRFIPTCVGWMPRISFASWKNSVHPHVRGVDLWGLIHQPFKRAVHPHVRGVDACRCRFRACVCGSSPRAWGGLKCFLTRWKRRPVHPHVRGVDAIPSRASVLKTNGSSPRAWGGCISLTMVLIVKSGSSPRAWGG